MLLGKLALMFKSHVLSSTFDQLDDFIRRINLCNWYLRECRENFAFFDQVIWLEETHFTNRSIFNKKSRPSGSCKVEQKLIESIEHHSVQINKKVSHNYIFIWVMWILSLAFNTTIIWLNLLQLFPFESILDSVNYIYF